MEPILGFSNRGLAFHPNGRFVYLANEDSTLTTFALNSSTGQLKHLQTESTLPPGFDRKNSCGDIHVHPNGRWLYVSNRGHNSVVIYHLDIQSGLPTAGLLKRAPSKAREIFTSHRLGRFMLVANRKSKSLSVFHVDPETGLLNLVGEPVPTGGDVSYVGVLRSPAMSP